MRWPRWPLYRLPDPWPWSVGERVARRAAGDGVFHAQQPALVPRGRTVVTCFDLIPACFPEYLSGAGPGARGRWPTVTSCAGCGEARLVLTPSHETAADATRLAGVDPGRIRVVPLAAPAPAAPVGAPPEGPYVLFTGAIEPHKNAGLAVEAIARAAPPMRLLMAGPWSARRAQRLREHAARAGAGDRVAWLGLVEAGRLAALRAGATAVLVPSRKEGFGLPVLEAMQVGVPVLASDTPGPARGGRRGGALPAARRSSRLGRGHRRAGGGPRGARGGGGARAAPGRPSSPGGPRPGPWWTRTARWPRDAGGDRLPHGGPGRRRGRGQRPLRDHPAGRDGGDRGDRRRRGGAGGDTPGRAGAGRVRAHGGRARRRRRRAWPAPRRGRCRDIRGGRRGVHLRVAGVEPLPGAARRARRDLHDQPRVARAARPRGAARPGAALGPPGAPGAGALGDGRRRRGRGPADPARQGARGESPRGAGVHARARARPSGCAPGTAWSATAWRSATWGRARTWPPWGRPCGRCATADWSWPWWASPATGATASRPRPAGAGWGTSTTPSWPTSTAPPP